MHSRYIRQPADSTDLGSLPVHQSDSNFYRSSSKERGRESSESLKKRFFSLLSLGSSTDGEKFHPEKWDYEENPVQPLSKEQVNAKGEKKELVALNLCWKRKHSPEVSGICLRICEGDIFCLVDPDKETASTVLDLLCGRLRPTAGEINFDEKTLKACCKSASTVAGYCPRTDAHLSHLSGREILTLHAKLRGMQISRIRHVIDVYLTVFQLYSVGDKQIRTLSENKKRRLSLAVALIGEPEIIFLNDPMNHLDINSKTVAWKALKKIKEMGRTIVMSSNSMDECAILATEVAVMVRGRVACIGKPSDIRRKYCNSYTLLARIDTLNRSVSTTILVQSLMERFPGCVLYRDHQDYVHMHVPYESDSLADIFALMESTKKHLKIKDYTLRHTTLNQVLRVFQQHTEHSDQSSEVRADDDDDDDSQT